MTESENPFELFASWFSEAQENEPNDPNAMALATVGPDGMPSVRMVLLKGFDETGFTFYTNLSSRKGSRFRTMPKRLSACTGSRSAARSASRATSNRSATPKRMPTLPAGPVTARSVPGPAASRTGWRAGSSWKSGWRALPRSSASVRCRGRLSGAAFGCARRESSSGARGIFGCMKDSCIIAAPTAGPPKDCSPDKSTHR